MTRSPESAPTPISAGGYRYDPDDAQDRYDFLRHTPAELAKLARERGYDFTDHHRYDPLVVDAPMYEPAPLTEAEQAERAAYSAAAAERRVRGEVYGHELDDADLGETAATGWPEHSPGLGSRSEADQMTAARIAHERRYGR